MTGSPRQLPLSRLGHLIPPLVESQALVALVPTTADLVWAAKAAWDIARIAARGGRRVALVDLCVEEPALHQRNIHRTEVVAGNRRHVDRRLVANGRRECVHARRRATIPARL